MVSLIRSAFASPATFPTHKFVQGGRCTRTQWHVQYTGTRTRTTLRAAAESTTAAEATESVVAEDLGLMRIGHGYDLHRLEAGRPLVLGGLNLPHGVGCAGHSDGDAVYHCVVDAILGALALPDIGQLFPDTDPRFKDQDSHVFMTAAYARMHLAGYRIGNLDITLIIERPKIAPHKETMRRNIAELLHTPMNCVNLKAKTHEKVDAVGENRAVEVHAVVVLLKDNPGWTPTVSASPSASANETIPDEVRQARTATASMLNAVAARVNTITDIKNGTTNTKEGDSEMVAKEDVKVTEQGGTAASHAGANASSSECAVNRLYNSVMERARADKDESWTAKLFSKGRTKIAQKVGEEAVEVVVDAVADNSIGVVSESADLLYHLCVLWAHMGIEPNEVFDELSNRRGTSGIAEKDARK